MRKEGKGREGALVGRGVLTGRRHRRRKESHPVFVPSVKESESGQYRLFGRKQELVRVKGLRRPEPGGFESQHGERAVAAGLPASERRGRSRA